MAQKNQKLVSTTTPRADFKHIGALLVGVTSLEISVDASKLEAPSNLYDADTAWVKYQRGRLSIFFAKTDASDPSSLLSRIEVRYAPESFLETFLKQSSEFAQRIEKYCSQWGGDVAAVANDSRTAMRAQKSHSAWSNYTHMAFSGTEAAVDFYHLSAVAVAKYSRLRDTAGLLLRPVMRVQLSTFDLHQLLTQSTTVAEAIRKDLPATKEPAE